MHARNPFLEQYRCDPDRANAEADDHSRSKPAPAGFHLVTDEVVAGAPDLGDVEAGLLHL